MRPIRRLLVVLRAVLYFAYALVMLIGMISLVVIWKVAAWLGFRSNRLTHELRNWVDALFDRAALAVRSAWVGYDRWQSWPAKQGISIGGLDRDALQTYLRTRGRTKVSSLTDVADWLKGCKYTHRSVPGASTGLGKASWFEAVRKGNCVPHALWAWAALHRLGYNPLLVQGEYLLGHVIGRGHVWVMFEDDDEQWLFEASAKKKAPMILAFQSVEDRYRPWYAIDTRGQVYKYPGRVDREIDALEDAEDRSMGVEQA